MASLQWSPRLFSCRIRGCFAAWRDRKGGKGRQDRGGEETIRKEGEEREREGR